MLVFPPLQLDLSRVLILIGGDILLFIIVIKCGNEESLKKDIENLRWSLSGHIVVIGTYVHS